MDNLIRFYRKPALSKYKTKSLLKQLKDNISPNITEIQTEICFNIAVNDDFRQDYITLLRWLLSETFEKDNFSDKPFLYGDVIEIGPRLNFATPWCSNALSIFKACAINGIERIEQSKRYKIITATPLSSREISDFISIVHDPMTECLYEKPISTFTKLVAQSPVRIIPLIEEGKSSIKKLNIEMGLGFDEWDMDYYYNLFVNDLKRNPTDVELFDLSQSNSEHSRHWFFRGNLIVRGKPTMETLFHIVKSPFIKNPRNSIIAFKDNSSAIRGAEIKTIYPLDTRASTPYVEKNPFYHIIFTAETHNFPTGVAPFPGAETGTGGRIRDVHATGRGSLVVAGTAGYCVGNLFIPDYPLKWEHGSLIYPKNLASPLKIIIEASNGASDYGNKFGEPLIQGITRSFGIRLHDNTRWEWIKPIMFTGGIGQIDDLHINKLPPQKGMLVVKIGGPAYRIGIGGGSASSMISGENIEALDFNAVQRGDAEMEQKLNRVIRACVERGIDNPIISIHDQGAGGNCNVVKEIIYPEGAKIDINKIILGDNTLSYLEIWGAEYQEQDALLIQKEMIDDFIKLCDRERLPVSVIGEITGDGRLFLFSSRDNIVIEDLPLEKALGNMPQKTYELFSLPLILEPLKFNKNESLENAIEMVLRHLSVCSKRFLTTKVDRSVTGLIAQQQCVGALQLPLSDFAMISQSHFSKDGKFSGAALSIGEQPIKSLINPSSMARLSVAEALTNIVWSAITDIEDIKCSANWMWAPKLEGEGIKLYYAAKAMSDFMINLGIAVDGGKDSLSMAAKVLSPNGYEEIVKSPPALVISAYAPVEDITIKATPDIKLPGLSKIMFIDLSDGFNRLGGSILAHCLKQIGDDCPDVCEPLLFKNAFKSIQLLLKEGFILAGHDRSDGGLITALLEMAFAGNCGLDIRIEFSRHGVLKCLFSEEPGLLFEYLPSHEFHIISLLERFEVPYIKIATTLKKQEIRLSYNDELIYQEDMLKLRDIWEETSFRLDRLQANPDCVEEERKAVYGRKGISYKIIPLEYSTVNIITSKNAKPAVAIIREEGSNGDREMASAFYYAGFEPWDVTMTDLLSGKIRLSIFKGIAFVGGFSYADVLDSAKGWAGSIKFNKEIYKDFDDFYYRTDTFSLGVCNGCQLMALLGWIPYREIDTSKQPRFIHNISGRFESRFLSVKILPSPSIMLNNMSESVLGVWIAHGEGRAYFPDEQIYEEIISNSLAPIRYVDDNHEITESYPFNPNGSKDGIAALCSKDGRHLAMMPHPERAFLNWQWPWLPQGIDNKKFSPWINLFCNARKWIENSI